MHQLENQPARRPVQEKSAEAENSGQCLITLSLHHHHRQSALAVRTNSEHSDAESCARALMPAQVQRGEVSVWILRYMNSRVHISKVDIKPCENNGTVSPLHGMY